MTPEEKDLLLRDLCARLPYEVKMIDTEPYSAEHNPILTLSYISEDNGIGCRAGKGFMATSLGSIKPYLLPLSSMTDEQTKEIQEIIGNPNYACIMRKTGGLVFLLSVHLYGWILYLKFKIISIKTNSITEVLLRKDLQLMRQG